MKKYVFDREHLALYLEKYVMGLEGVGGETSFCRITFNGVWYFQNVICSAKGHLCKRGSFQLLTMSSPLLGNSYHSRRIVTSPIVLHQVQDSLSVNEKCYINLIYRFDLISFCQDWLPHYPFLMFVLTLCVVVLFFFKKKHTRKL